jgi:lysyl-tRNA synthetase class 2
VSELDEQIRVRREKRERLRAEGVDPYPARAPYDLEPADVHARYGERSREELEAAPLELTVPGRVRSLREHGKTTFLDLHDGRGKLQIYLRRGDLDAGAGLVLDHLDLGDLVAARGPLIRTRTGELTLQARELRLLAKALRPLPEKWHGLADLEARHRQRYLDLAINPESRRVFEVRAAIVSGVRDFLDRRGFIEVETPMMNLVPTGAAARPFVTHHNALDLDLYLRIAPELYLKRLVVGGLHRVYEINRNFRNEGISTQHNPEFTMLEFYCAYADYQELMSLTEELLVELAQNIHGTLSLPWKGGVLELAPPWRRYTMRQAITELGGVGARQLEDADGVAAALAERGAELPAGLAAGRPLDEQEGAYGRLLMALFEAAAEPHLVQPTFILDYPVEVSPFSKQRPDEPRFTERFELYMGGMEIANAFSELNDPDVQADRFRQQGRARERGDEEAHRFDDDYVRALEHGMPPTGGEGIGIDRLAMLFTDRHSIRDVILFPLMKPQS